MRLLITALMVFINFILQTTLLQMFAIRGVLPNTALIIAVSYALLRGSREGAFVGIGAGLLQDIFFWRHARRVCPAICCACRTVRAQPA